MNEFIGKNVKDLSSGLIEKVIDATSNSLLITQTKQSAEGINCSNWFTSTYFDKNFKITMPS